jgi:enolase
MHLLTESSISHAYNCGFSVFLSSSTPETTDDFIADLSVGLRTGAVKLGAESVGKLNRLLDIEEELKSKGEEVTYAGKGYRSAYMDGRGDEGKRPLNLYGY